MTDSAVHLVWPGKSAPHSAPEGRLEVTRPGDPCFRLVRGDGRATLHALGPELEGKAALAYLDPPFFTGRQHDRVHRARDPKTGHIERSTSPAFDDRWENLGAYLRALGDRVAAARRLLARDGCLVLHVDPKTSHYAKVLLDEIFGVECFASEIVWRYRRWPAKTPNFQRVHDVLLRYVKDAGVRPRFHQLYEPLAPSTLATWGKRKQRAVVGEDGRRIRSSRTSDTTPGAPLGDVWEIGIVAPVSKERTGYPTQKPLALLARIVEACTKPGDLVVDPYLGSGTTLVAAARLGRSGLGIDLNPEAIALADSRLADAGIRPCVESLVSPSLDRHGDSFPTSPAPPPVRPRRAA